MVGRAAARRRDRGGERIATFRASTLRVAAAAAAALLGAALALWPLLDAGDAASLVQTLAIVSGVALAAAIVGLPGSPAVAAAGLATEAVLAAVASGLSTPAAVAEGIALLVLCELLSWRTTIMRGSVVERSLAGQRLALLVLVCAAAAVAALFVVAGGEI